ncbi:CGCGG family rSAM-modified RiPP protein [Halovivax sp.]|uniref:CGCGG family putative rSAM-modified RiPP protein n=1 Tax=Halovivax sp. TaxID=1935978 RepID=UPI0025C30A5D|nr:CGCGG family rSAM-modified RiPP protein [Halovivax sp.]
MTRRVHENSWSANLEEPRHADDRELLVDEAIDAVEATAPGYHVNLVTHGAHGHPREYLWPALEEHATRAGESIEWTYVDRCGCGGHVTRVHVG